MKDRFPFFSISAIISEEEAQLLPLVLATDPQNLAYTLYSCCCSCITWGEHLAFCSIVFLAKIACLVVLHTKFKESHMDWNIRNAKIISIFFFLRREIVSTHSFLGRKNHFNVG